MQISESLQKYGQGAIAGGITIGALQPFFTIVNLTMSGTKIPSFYKTPLFFWSGLVPNLLAEVASQAMSLGTYSFMSGKVNNDHAAIIAGVCNAPVLAPFEHLMVKRQEKQLVLDSYMETVKKIFKTQGVKYLFNGLSPTIVREVIFAHTAYHSSDKIAGKIHQYVPHKKSADILAQLGLGAICGVVTNPFQLIAVKMQSNGTKISLKDVVSGIIKEEGIIGFSKGYKERAILVSFLMVGMKQSQALVSYFFENRYV